MTRKTGIGLALAAIAAAVFYWDFARAPAADAPAMTPGIVVRNDGSAKPVAASSARQTDFVVLDRQGFSEPMPAYRLSAPAGWQGQGQILWDVRNPCLAISPALQWQGQSADGAQVIEVIPRWVSQQRSSATTPQIFRGCPDAPIASARQYLEQLARQRHPGAQTLDYRERPDLSAKVAVMQTPPVSGIQRRAWAEAGQLTIGWQDNGSAMREVLLVSARLTELTAQMPMVGPQTVRAIEAFGAVTLRAPQDQLDVDLLNRVLASATVEPQWQAQIAQMHQNMAEDDARTARKISEINHQGAQFALKQIEKRGQIMADTRAQVSEIQNQTWQNTQDTNERIHKNTLDALRNVQPYYDPERGSAVEVDNRYDYLWRLEDGTYFQTNDPNFNPNQALGISGQQLNPVKR